MSASAKPIGRVFAPPRTGNDRAQGRAGIIAFRGKGAILAPAWM
jgi:hypothetical protein